jgi:hypothetical protein
MLSIGRAIVDACLASELKLLPSVPLPRANLDRIPVGDELRIARWIQEITDLCGLQIAPDCAVNDQQSAAIPIQGDLVSTCGIRCLPQST